MWFGHLLQYFTKAVKRSGREGNYSPLSSAEFKHVCLRGMDSGNFTLYCLDRSKCTYRHLRATKISIVGHIRRRNIKGKGKIRRSQWPRGLRRRSTAARLLRSWVRIPPGAWMFVCCMCCVLSGRGLCKGLITRPEESYRLWRVAVCEQVTSYARRLKPDRGL